jgi:hypothetical protein
MRNVLADSNLAAFNLKNADDLPPETKLTVKSFVRLPQSIWLVSKIADSVKLDRLDRTNSRDTHHLPSMISLASSSRRFKLRRRRRFHSTVSSPLRSKALRKLELPSPPRTLRSVVCMLICVLRKRKIKTFIDISGQRNTTDQSLGDSGNKKKRVSLVVNYNVVLPFVFCSSPRANTLRSI